ncbi:MAG: restriction endonuclease subunit R [Leptolyngbyaceae cyanobacterium RU_5_1]|nr:restriction endonuclease subunit R [Leptolyngbyaceae cyanobacterium RU_5_1]
MVQTIPAKDITFAQLGEMFGLERSDNEQFFRERQDNIPELSDLEKQALNEVKRDYMHLSRYTLLEPIVKMVILSPLLKLAGFYRPPFYLAAEKEVEIVSEDEGTIVRGRLDVLVFQPQFWVTVIEAKNTQYSLEVGVPQALTYMMANPHTEKPAYGFVTNGREFEFLKLTQQGEPRYSRSYPFSIDRGDDLHRVLAALKHVAQLAQQS